MTEQYCLRWNNHQSTVISVFENLLESGSLIDCTLCADGKLLKAHKVVLSACSSVFESMLCQQGGDKHPIIFLKDVRFEEMKAMLDYMYKGEANVHQELLDSFLKTAASLQIKGLTDQGGGGGTDEPPPKKGPGVNANRKAPPPLDATPESSREGSISPTMSRKRRRPTNNMAGVRRPSSEDASADNSCDTIPMSSAQNVSNQQYQAAPPVASQPPSLPMPQPSQSMETARVTIKKQEPLDQTPQSMIQPKTEFIDESNEDVEDLTLDDDDDYNDSMSEMSKPGTSYSMQQPSQDFQWSQMMGGNDSRSGADESFMQQDSVNNQGNTQGQKKVEKFICKCARVFRDKEVLRLHLKQDCTIATALRRKNDDMFQCPACPYKTKRKEHLDRHIESHRRGTVRSVRKATKRGAMPRVTKTSTLPDLSIKIKEEPVDGEKKEERPPKRVRKPTRPFCIEMTPSQRKIFEKKTLLKARREVQKKMATIRGIPIDANVPTIDLDDAEGGSLTEDVAPVVSLDSDDDNDSGPQIDSVTTVHKSDDEADEVETVAGSEVDAQSVTTENDSEVNRNGPDTLNNARKTIRKKKKKPIFHICACERRFSSKEDLEEHKLCCRWKAEDLRCGLCPLEFKTLKDVTRHENTSHFRKSQSNPITVSDVEERDDSESVLSDDLDLIVLEDS